MNAYPRNDFDWPNMSEVDDYLDARIAAQKVAQRVLEAKRDLARLSQALDARPAQAALKIPSNWLTADDWRHLLNDAHQAFQLMDARWNQVPLDRQKSVSPPFQTVDDSAR